MLSGLSRCSRAADGPEHTEPARRKHTGIGIVHVAAAVLASALTKTAGARELRALRMTALACMIWPFYVGTTVIAELIAPFGAGDIVGYEWFVARDWMALGLTALPVMVAFLLLRNVHRHGGALWPWLLGIAVGPVAALVGDRWGIGTYGLVELSLPLLVTLAMLSGGLLEV